MHPSKLSKIQIGVMHGYGGPEDFSRFLKDFYWKYNRALAQQLKESDKTVDESYDFALSEE